MIKLTLKLVCLSLVLSACSSKSGGSGNSSEYGDGNIPLAQAGAELQDVNFAFDSSALDMEAKSKLDKNAEWLSKNDGRDIVIEGHCDERGTVEYNLALGERRAQSVANYLENLGVSSSRISTVSYGEEIPLDPASNEDAWAKNRRAHFAIQ